MAAYQDTLIAQLGRLSREELLSMYRAAADAMDCVFALARNGSNPLSEVLGGAQVVEELAHFPPGDVFDPTTYCRYYYHAHADADCAPGEYGHFHVSVRSRQLASELVPTPGVQGERPMDETDWITHLVGISTDEAGRVIRLFTTNRWVTGSVWYDADAVIVMLDRFAITVDQPSYELNRFVTAVVRMFRPQIAELVRARDLRIAEYQAAHPERNVFEDRDLQITSQAPVDFFNQINAIEAAVDLQKSLVG